MALNACLFSSSILVYVRIRQLQQTVSIKTQARAITEQTLLSHYLNCMQGFRSRLVLVVLPRGMALGRTTEFSPRQYIIGKQRDQSEVQQKGLFDNNISSIIQVHVQCNRKTFGLIGLFCLQSDVHFTHVQKYLNLI